jgi:rod shape-determining protein MreD
MQPTKKLKLRLISAFPMAMAFGLLLLYVIPKHIGELSGVMPLLHMVPVFIWGVMHPRDISLPVLALFGLMVDVATSLPLGVSALGYCLFFLLVRSQRKYIYREGFAPMWGYFSLLLLAMQLACWAMVSFVQATLMPLGDALLQWLFTLLFYPLLHFMLYRWVEKMSHARYRLLHA